MKPAADIVELLDFIKTEIGAGMVLIPRTPADHAHNNACERANSIITNYQEGYGLFQMTRRSQDLMTRKRGPARTPPRAAQTSPRAVREGHHNA